MSHAEKLRQEVGAGVVAVAVAVAEAWGLLLAGFSCIASAPCMRERPCGCPAHVHTLEKTCTTCPRLYAESAWLRQRVSWEGASPWREWPQAWQCIQTLETRQRALDPKVPLCRTDLTRPPTHSLHFPKNLLLSAVPCLRPCPFRATFCDDEPEQRVTTPEQKHDCLAKLVDEETGALQERSILLHHSFPPVWLQEQTLQNVHLKE